MDHYFRLMNTPEEERTDLALAYFEGYTTNWYRMAGMHFQTWDAFKTALLEEFIPKDSHMRLRTELSGLSRKVHCESTSINSDRVHGLLKICPRRTKLITSCLECSLGPDVQ
ncbi:hypothetical protein O6H91_11G099400 [Diphasiastrum complanatum]|uniref:Uncharacterized protein n=1 Tax=Diphasiastrum complanatum TaxID=34168 RepID=A0ACC2CCC8_DIPCM|nr:hypothetical protein O6H91_Y157000 [Diphasiastrum complanatum]KAJ7539543.1 hypothetical protein O6H91_11G099400 [Diphasiastrum complanatum]